MGSCRYVLLSITMESYPYVLASITMGSCRYVLLSITIGSYPYLLVSITMGNNPYVFTVNYNGKLLICIAKDKTGFKN